MARFARRVPGLQDTFPSSDRSVAAPSEVAETVSLTHPWPGTMFRYSDLVRIDLPTPSANPPSVSDARVPDGFYDEIVFAHITHNSAGVQRIRLGISDITGGLIFVGLWVQLPSNQFTPVYAHGNGTGAATSTYAPHRIVVPPRWNLFIDGDTGGAAYIVTLQFARLRKPLTEAPTLIP